MPYKRCFKYLKKNSGVYKKPRSSKFSEQNKYKKKINKFLNLNLEEEIVHNFTSIEDSNTVSMTQNPSNLFSIDIQDSSITNSIDDNSTFEECSTESIYNGLLAVFYAGKLTQTAFKLVVDFFNIVTQNKLPSTFNQISSKLLNINDESIDYLKDWFCVQCKEMVVLTNPFQRKCSICLKRFLFTIFHKCFSKSINLNVLKTTHILQVANFKSNTSII